MEHIPEYLHLPVLSEVLTNSGNKAIPVKAATPRKAVVPSMQRARTSNTCSVVIPSMLKTKTSNTCNIGIQPKVQPATLRTKKSRVRWTPKENKTILRIKKHSCSWEEIHHALPHRTLGAIQVQYSTKLKKWLC
jgi:hypothetical protein